MVNGSDLAKVLRLRLLADEYNTELTDRVEWQDVRDRAEYDLLSELATAGPGPVWQAKLNNVLRQTCAPNRIDTVPMFELALLGHLNQDRLAQRRVDVQEVLEFIASVCNE